MNSWFSVGHILDNDSFSVKLRQEIVIIMSNIFQISQFLTIRALNPEN